MEEVDLVYAKAVDVLRKCSTENGFYAAFPGYDMVFARDSMIMSLGASLIGNEFRGTIEKSLKTLATNQSEKGQIPNAVDSWSSRKKHVDFKSIDSTLWFIVGLKNFEKKFGKLNLNENIKRALAWVSYQDFCENGTLTQLPTTDWQDAFPHKYGITINTQALYYRILNLYGKKKEALRLKKVINEDEDDGLWNGEFYLPWRWKNHGKYKEIGKWFDSLGNLLAIIYGLADDERAEKILKYIAKEKIAEPFPMKAIHPPIFPNSNEWQDYYLDCAAGTPYHYLNGGIWTFIGGFYVCALVKMKKFKEAKEQLEKLAKANLLEPLFSEWLEGENGKPLGGKIGKNEGNQGWNAGMFIVAYESVKKNKLLF